MITVTAEQRLKPGVQDKVDALMADLTAEVMHNEPGCARFDYIVDVTDPNRRLVVENYRDRAAFEAHKNTKYLANFMPKLLDMLEEPPVVTQFKDVFEEAKAAPYFHTGIVVDDLEEAIRHYSDTLNVQFTEPGTFNIPRLEDPDPHPFLFTAVLSMAEPPFLELIQANGTGIISPEKCGNIFYHGCWESDMAGRLAWLNDKGPGAEAVFRMEEGGTPFSMITHPDKYGNRIEYVGTEAAEPLIEWARTGTLPGGIGA